MVRDTPDTHDRTPPHDTHRAFPRRLIGALIVLTVLIMVWGGLAGYVALFVIGVILVIAFVAAYAATVAKESREIGD
jgi:uncharacterized membrane protein YccC